MSLENDLRQAMRRVPAPEGFAERVLARVEDRRSRLSGQAGLPVLHWWRAAVATFLLAAVLGGWGAHETMRRRERERALQQVLVALRIAGTQVARAPRAARDHLA